MQEVRTNFNSYEETLRDTIRRKRPMQVLEYGPGDSTFIMLDMLPDVLIISMENDYSYYCKMEKRLLNMKFNVTATTAKMTSFSKHKQHVILCYEQDESPYVNLIPGMRSNMQFGMAFIDGRHRVKCLDAVRCAYPGIAAVLHDADRAEYQDAINRWKFHYWSPQKDTVRLLGSR